MKKVGLPCKSVSELAFNKILANYSYKEKVSALTDLKCGYPNRHIMYYTEDELIAETYVIYEILGLEYELSLYWRQIVLKLNREQKELISDSITPAEAIVKVNGIIKKHYSNEEKLDIFSKHEYECASPLKSYPTDYLPKGVLMRFSDCYYYDINGAYASILSSMFPKCKNEFKYMFEHRHDHNDRFKNCFNFYVGCLTQNEDKRAAVIAKGMTPRVIYPKTRFYIVKQISDKLQEFERMLDSDMIIYENTDGVIVHKPKNTPAGSAAMNEFKLEYSGDIYIYRGENYWVMQFGDEMRGSLPVELRSKVDLRKGKAVRFDHIVRDNIHIYENVEEIEINEKSYKNV